MVVGEVVGVVVARRCCRGADSGDWTYVRVVDDGGRRTSHVEESENEGTAKAGVEAERTGR